MNKCYPCRWAELEEAAKGRVFIRCQKTGRVLESAPANYGRVILEDVRKPAWCGEDSNVKPR